MLFTQTQASLQERSKMKVNVVQTNIDYFQDAQDLLWKFWEEKRIDVTVVSEPYNASKYASWRTDTTR